MHYFHAEEHNLQESIYVEQVLYSIELELNSALVSVRYEEVLERRGQGDGCNRAHGVNKALVDHNLLIETKRVSNPRWSHNPTVHGMECK